MAIIVAAQQQCPPSTAPTGMETDASTRRQSLVDGFKHDIAAAMSLDDVQRLEQDFRDGLAVLDKPLRRRLRSHCPPRPPLDISSHVSVLVRPVAGLQMWETTTHR